MLCGELGSRASPLSLHLACVTADTRSPYPALLALCRGAAMALTAAGPPPDDEDIFLENGLLSYENPNYHLDPARLDDALNSNTDAADLYADIYHELDAVCNLSARAKAAVQGPPAPPPMPPSTGAPATGSPQQTTGGPQTPASQPGRRAYAALDIGSMGVDVSTGPVTNLDAAAPDNHNNRSGGGVGAGSPAVTLDNAFLADNANSMGRRSLDLTATLRAQPDLLQGAAVRDASGAPVEAAPAAGAGAGAGGKRRPPQLSSPSSSCDSPRASSSSPEPEADGDQDDEDDEDEDEDETEAERAATRGGDADASAPELPAGWERHEDNDGPYYWHIKSGTIQREPPLASGVPITLVETRRPLVPRDTEPTLGTVTRSSTSSALGELDGRRERDRERREELAYKRRSYPARAEPEAKERPIRFAVRSLGWVEIDEFDLTPERSSKAVNKCIVDLSLGRNDLLDVVGRWGDGKDLFMDLEEGALKLIDPENLTVLNTQPIQTIRVWGVGRDNGRDFAYVARDRSTRKHMCHVFRCDIPARTIANTLRDICKKIMIERSLQQNLAKPVDIGGVGGGRAGLAARPTNLPTEHRRFHHRNGQALVTQSFPTPMEEPKKVLRAQYLGSTQVTRAKGVDILNDAIDKMLATVPQEQWRPVSVAVAPSMISICQPGEEGHLLAECRVRYLSFLGIGRNVKQCGFIVHTAQDQFVAHIFHCEPSSGALCKTVEAACKLRYQKCLDAHPQGAGRGGTGGSHTPGRGLGATLKSLVGALAGRRLRGADS
ncbi:hypothetical protein R5R35_013791 [Gryllus longicercus]|uniref:Protein Fe65 homolog n=2 Tax=Gryllus longicercus TaxID=2509291 RepID=A0AAN9ZFG9_9ORTH